MGPEQVVISGDETQVLSLAQVLASQGLQTRRLAVSHAFHSPLMGPMLKDFARVAQGIAYAPPKLLLVSNLDGKLADASVASADYWVRHVSAPVRFAEGVAAVVAQGVEACVEIGPQPTLSALAAACRGVEDIKWLPSLHPPHEDGQRMRQSLGHLYVAGATVDWKGLFGTRAPRKVSLPTYAFQRERHWMQSAPQGEHSGKETGNPLLGVALRRAGPVVVYETTLSPTQPSYLADHQIFGAIVVPGTAWLEMARAAATARWGGTLHAVEDLLFEQPLTLSGNARVQLVVEEDDSLTIWGQDSGADFETAWTKVATGRLRRESAVVAPAPISPEALRDGCEVAADTASGYAQMAARGLVYGEAFRGLKWLGVRGDTVVGKIEVPALDGGPGLHPGLLDAALQSLSAVSEHEGVFLPFAVTSYVAYQSGVTTAWVEARVTSRNADTLSSDLTLWDASGAPVARLDGVRCKRAEAAQVLRKASTVRFDWLYRVDWVPLPVAGSAALAAGRWLVVATPARVAVAQSLVEQLNSAGASATVCDGTAGLSAALSTLPENEAAQVVALWGPSTEANPGTQAQALAIEGLAHLQALVKSTGKPSSRRLWWVTAGAVSAFGDDLPELAASSLWGLARTWMQEHPEWSTALVDLSTWGFEGLTELRQELDARDGESQVAWRGGKRLGARMARAPKRPAGLTAADGESYQLESPASGKLEDLRLSSGTRRSPDRGEVEVEVEATGLNFRDVLTALGQYPGGAGPLGCECSGVITAVGADVTTFTVGQPVMAVAPGSFSRHVTLDARQVIRRPLSLTAIQAAGVPLPFLTAWYALVDLARLRPQERILIHAASGGVGMAAVQLAKHWGARVFATASRSKWGAVRALGVDHVFNSRSVDFADELRASTGLVGVDIVLNALTGSFVDAGLSLLSDGGRFLEMGKRDLRDPKRVAQAHPGVRYQAFDLFEAGPDRVQAMLQELVRLFDQGVLRAPPTRAFPLAEAETAFRFMAQARHVGKLVLRAPPRPGRPGSYLVTGGLGALGLEVARWVARSGRATHLVLLAVNPPGEVAQAAIEELRTMGVTVQVALADVSDVEGVRRVLDAVPNAAPLRGLLHLAGALDDGVLMEQDAARMAHVLQPKATGAWNLHALTRELELECFVLFSSSASVMGSPGQGNYAAANSFLDALAAHRRARGLAATTVAWGPWAHRGMAARLGDAERQRLSRLGFGWLEPAQALDLLAVAIDRPEPALVALPLDLQRLEQGLNHGPLPSMLRSLVQPPAAQSQDLELVSWLGALPPARRRDALVQRLREDLYRVMGTLEIASDRPLRELGLDSLMAVEVRNLLAAKVGRPLPATLLFDHPTLDALATFLLEQLLALSEQLPSAPSPAVDRPDDAIAIIGLGCRFPGGITDPESFWKLLRNGVDAISEVPADRWGR
jgi:acyl transferase domain-containing protein/acyl carrier protein